MRVIKKFIQLSVLLIMSISFMSVLMQQTVMYQKAYVQLSRKIAHSSIDVKTGGE